LQKHGRHAHIDSFICTIHYNFIIDDLLFRLFCPFSAPCGYHHHHDYHALVCIPLGRTPLQ
jgi:hypothetical protein